MISTYGNVIVLEICKILFRLAFTANGRSDHDFPSFAVCRLPLESVRVSHKHENYILHYSCNT